MVKKNIIKTKNITMENINNIPPDEDMYTRMKINKNVETIKMIKETIRQLTEQLKLYDDEEIAQAPEEEPTSIPWPYSELKIECKEQTPKMKNSKRQMKKQMKKQQFGGCQCCDDNNCLGCT